MPVINPKDIATRDFHQFLLGAVAPRPIAFVSTVDADGNPNLAPYSFFNAFSSNPPMLVFSSNRRVSNNTTKDTLANVMATKEAVINVVNWPIVRQMAVTSVEFDPGVSEFEQAGFTPVPSDIVKAPRVKESPVNMECVVRNIITLGEHGGAGHLILCEVVRMHIDDAVVDENNRIDPHKIDLMGRMGRAYYVRASGEAVHTIVQAVTEPAIGWQSLPESVRNSSVLTGNEIGMLAGLKEVPSGESVKVVIENDERVKECLASGDPLKGLHQYASELLKKHRNRDLAGQVVWAAEA